VKRIQLLPFGEFDKALLADLSTDLARVLSASCEILDAPLDASRAYNAERRQYSSTQILGLIGAHAATETSCVLGITSLDLYIPVLTFVFGEAQLGGACAVVSAHRLMQEFYGLPPHPDLLRARLLKEAVHELGHTLSLAHCDDYECVMASSHAVERIDLKSTAFCPDCRSKIFDAVPEGSGQLPTTG
jgi:archaemetzincin